MKIRENELALQKLKSQKEQEKCLLQQNIKRLKPIDCDEIRRKWNKPLPKFENKELLEK